MQLNARYSGFISYCHTDKKAATQLLKRLQTYKLPKLKHATSSRRLGEFFMDMESLPVASDLSEAILDGLAKSNSLIVLCSPSAAASRWVHLEVENFKRLKPHGSIFAVILAEPANAQNDVSEYFPSALLSAGQEPLAADFRKTADGPKLGFLKLAAALSDTRLEDLLRRDQSRQRRRVTAITAAAAAITLSMSTLAVLAFTGQREAEARRTDAEGLVDFMLTDLKERLEPVGRLDALDGVADEVLDYYEQKAPEELTCDATSLWAQALSLSVSIDLDGGRFDEVFDTLGQSKGVSNLVQRRCETVTTGIYYAAQVEYWFGEAWLRRWRSGARVNTDLMKVKEYWENYDALSQMLLELDPLPELHKKEAAYAKSNLGTWALHAEEYEEAVLNFEQALDFFASNAEQYPEDVSIQLEYVDAISWLANALSLIGQFDVSLSYRKQQLGALEALDQKLSEKNWRVHYYMAVTHLRALETYLDMGRLDDAEKKITELEPLIDELRTHDASNSRWQEMQAGLESQKGKLLSQRVD